jgi:hypothetical protein
MEDSHRVLEEGPGGGIARYGEDDAPKALGARVLVVLGGEPGERDGNEEQESQVTTCEHELPPAGELEGTGR